MNVWLVDNQLFDHGKLVGKLAGGEPAVAPLAP